MTDVTVQTYTNGQVVGTRQETIDNTQVNRESLSEQARQALATNRTFLAVASPTNAQVVAQVKALTRQSNGVIRLLLNQLDGTD